MNFIGPFKIKIVTFSLLLCFLHDAQAHDDSLHGKGRVPNLVRKNMNAFQEEHHHNEHLAEAGSSQCVDGMAADYPCKNIELVSFVPLDKMGGGNGNDIWGWTDPSTGKEYAIMGLTNGTSFIDISNPHHPLFLGHLPPHPGVAMSSWRDIKTYNNHAFISSEALNSGIQVVDLTQLRNITTPPVKITETAFYDDISTSHNIVINEDSGYAYGVGLKSGDCSSGLHFIDISTPASPQFAGCFGADGYTHDAQCVNYHGPDPDHQGKEICFAFNEDTLTIVDVSNKTSPIQISRTFYVNTGYSHQGWATDDHAWLLLDDELDERNIETVTHTRTLIWNIADLDSPVHHGDYTGVTTAIDHNQYIVGNYSYQANYSSGLRIIDINDIANTQLAEVAFFDIYPENDNVSFNGAWSVYPFFSSGIVIVSGIEQGLFLLRPDLSGSVAPGNMIFRDGFEN